MAVGHGSSGKEHTERQYKCGDTHVDSSGIQEGLVGERAKKTSPHDRCGKGPFFLSEISASAQQKPRCRPSKPWSGLRQVFRLTPSGPGLPGRWSSGTLGDGIHGGYGGGPAPDFHGIPYQVLLDT
ncbi:hypothetical protein JCM12178A_17760 [Salidesulfovibrio brasiliensis]